MRLSHPASLLVAALVMLRRPCPRNQATARLLLTRAAEFSSLTPAEREACLSLADELDMELTPPSRPASRTTLSPPAPTRPTMRFVDAVALDA